MDLNNNVGEAEDRVSELPDSLLHHILSFVDIKCAACTSVLSKRWNYIWTSIPTLIIPFWYHSMPHGPHSLSAINKFMEFVDRTLLLHDRSSNIQKFQLRTNKHMSASRVHSWMESLIRGNVKEVTLWLDQDKPFFIPLSLFTCESLVKLELSLNNATHLPKSFCFPKLKSLKLCGIRFTDDCWNEQHFYNCPVLEGLTLESCTWFDVRNFCISIPTLKVLEIYNLGDASEGLQDCALKIYAPDLVSLIYCGGVAKEYILSSFQKLESAEVHLGEFDGVFRVQQIGYRAAVTKFFRALAYVQCLEIYAETLETFVSILPVFHKVDELILKEGKDGKTNDQSLFALLKIVPNLRWLSFEESCLDDNKEHSWVAWVGHMLTAPCMFQQLELVRVGRFRGSSRQMRWVELILKNAKALEKVILSLLSSDAINKEVLMSGLLSLPRASDRCEFQLPVF